MNRLDLPCVSNEVYGACPGRVVCSCLQITEEVLIAAIGSGEVRSVRDIRCQTGAGDGCTSCHALLQQYLERYAPVPGPGESALPICSAR